MPTDQLYRGSTYFDLILQGLCRWPEREAIVDAGGMALTYAGLEERIWRTARALRDAGLNRGDGVAQLAANRVDTFVTMAAVLANGMRYTPLHPLGSLEDQLFILDDANIRALVVDVPAYEERGADLASGVDSELKLYTLGEGSFGADLTALAAAAEADVLTALPGFDDIAWVTYRAAPPASPRASS